MRKIVAGLFISLDGVVESPDKWQFPYWDDDQGQIIGEAMAAADTMLLGRVTYQEFASYWPNADSDAEMAAYMNNTPKLVVSNTLQSADWTNSTLVSGDVAQELRRLKAQPGKNIAITGSGTLVGSLLRDNLLDELQMLVYPVVVGHGKRLFPEGTDKLGLRLTDAKTLNKGVLALTYAPDR